MTVIEKFITFNPSRASNSSGTVAIFPSEQKAPNVYGGIPPNKSTAVFARIKPSTFSRLFAAIFAYCRFWPTLCVALPSLERTMTLDTKT